MQLSLSLSENRIIPLYAQWNENERKRLAFIFSLSLSLSLSLSFFLGAYLFE